MQSLEMKRDEDVLVLSFVDRKITDQKRITQIDADLQYATGLAADGRVLVDFDGLSFMSSAMIGALLRFQKKCDGESINVKFCNISSDIKDVFHTQIELSHASRTGGPKIRDGASCTEGDRTIWRDRSDVESGVV